MNVLITNVGRRSYLIDFIRSAPTFTGKVFVSDCDSYASGLYAGADAAYLLPRPTDDEQGYIDALVKLCKEESISLVIPVIDPEIYILSQYRDYLESRGIKVFVSSREVLEICYNKQKMNEFLERNGFLVPKTCYSVEEFVSNNPDFSTAFPVFLKPIYGSGSVDSCEVDNIDTLRVLFKSGMLIQEYLDGEEFGADIFSLGDGIARRIVLKRKISMRSGETDKAITVFNSEILSTLSGLTKDLQPYGPLDCDIINTKKGHYIIDMNPRLGGGYPATHMAGVNFLDLMFRNLRGERIEADLACYIADVVTTKDVGIKSFCQDSMKLQERVL